VPTELVKENIMAKNAVATIDQASTALATETDFDYGEYAGVGFEDTGKDDYSIPFLAVLQQMSPELETMEAAKAGMLINSVTQDLFKGSEGITFVPCARIHQFVEWVPRTQGGGLVGMHEPGSDVVVAAKERNAGGDFGKLSHNGNDLIETYYVYGLHVVSEDEFYPVCVTFSSTKIKKYKAMMTKANMVQIKLPNGRRVNAPLFAHTYSLKTVSEKNNKGSFHNFDINFSAGNATGSRIPTASDLFQSAVSLNKMVMSGAAKADYSKAEGGSSGGSESNSPDIDTEIPF
jgi:hypothetical protein